VPDDVLSGRIIGAAIEVHRKLGPGLLESAYQQCLAAELEFRGIPFRREVPLPLRYRDVSIDAAYRLDFLVADRVIVEIKSVDAVSRIHEAQLLTYLKLSGKNLGLILNFNALLLRDGIVRIAN
jgi:GxxExxY protein